MRKNMLIYIIYLLMICLITAYFSVKIIQRKISIPLTGKFVSFSSDEERLIKELEKYASVPAELRIKSHEGDYRNSEGFRDYEHEVTKPNNTIRILALGDSFTEGSWVRINYTWPRQLERKLNQIKSSTRFEVFNFGRGGAGTLEEVKLLKEKGIKYSPDIVILLYYPNDWEDSLWIMERSRELWKNYKNGSFKFPDPVERRIKELNAQEEDVSRLIMEIAIQEFRSYANQKGLVNLWKENVEKPLIELIQICKKHNIKLVIISIDLPYSEIRNQRELLDNFLSSYNIPFLDLTSYFPLGSEKLRVQDGHLSEEGYDLLSNKIIEFMLNLSLVS